MAADSDRVVHLAFKHEWMRIGDFEGSANADRHAVEALGETLAGSDRPLVTASGTAGLALGRVATEADGHGEPSSALPPRSPHSTGTAEFSEPGLPSGAWAV